MKKKIYFFVFPSIYTTFATGINNLKIRNRCLYECKSRGVYQFKEG